MTLTELAGQIGISAPHLSRLEKGERQPSIGTLLQIAKVYGVSVGELVEERDDKDYHLVRAGEEVVRPGRDGRYSVLSGPRAAVAVVRVELTPGKHTRDARHPGEEWLHVLGGRTTFTLGDDTLELGAGDSVHFDASRPHRLSCPDEPATVLIVSTAHTAPMHHPVPTRTHR